MQKTTSPMQQHSRFKDFHVRNINTFGEVIEIASMVSSYLNSRHLTVPSVRNDCGPAGVNRKGRQEGKEEKGGMEKEFTKERAQAKERTKARKGKGEGCKGMRGQGEETKVNSKEQGCLVCGDTSRWSGER